MRPVFILLATAAWPALALAQVQPVADDTAFAQAESYDGDLDGEEIVVEGTRPPGSVVGDIQPDIVLNPADIRAYGASNLGELLQELAPLTGSIQGRGGGQPVMLLGGRRISGFREIRDLPPEAVIRIDILPEEVALKYGYRADQRVVNIVLRPRFNAVTGEVEALATTEGGRQEYEADFNYLRLADGSRLSIDAEYEHKTPLFESERDVIAADPDRTLLSESDSVELEATYNRTILGNVSATLTGGVEAQESLSSQGRSQDGTQRLLRDARTSTGELRYALNGDAARWRWSLDGGYTRNWSLTLTDRDLPGGVGRDRARSVSETVQTEGTLSGDLFRLPAGTVTATLKGGLNLRDIASDSTRAGLAVSTDLSRDQGNGQLNLDAPVLRNSPVGRLSINGNGSIDRLSDFGTLRSYGFGFNWEPIRDWRLIASVTQEEGAPSIQQLGNPVIATPNVRVFDATRGETVDVILVEGGNPVLLADDRRVIKLGLSVKPIGDTDLTLLADFTDSRIDNPTASLPTATPEIEAAFPDRFIRDAGGTLLRVDSRPVNFQRSRQKQIRWGFNWSETLEAPPPAGPDGRPLTQEQIEARREAFRAAAQARGAPPGAPPGQGQGGGQPRGPGGPGGPGGFAGFPGGFGGGPGGFAAARQGRVQVSLFHTWRLEDTILIRDGIPELDLLDGSSVSGRGGQPEHQVQLQLGYNRSGLGARAFINWQSATTLRADPVGGTQSPDDLKFGALTTINLRLFADLAQQRWLGGPSPFLRGARVTLAIDNLLDDKTEVRNRNGVTPIGYQQDLLDPLGRTVRLSFRKLFF